MIRSCDFLILGAGPTGLGAAYRLKEMGELNFLVLEAQDDVGGLSRSFVDDAGFTWDIGGHVQFSHYEYFDEVMEQAVSHSDRHLHEREAWVYFNNKFIPYPFQNNIHLLHDELAMKCLSGLQSIPKTSSPRNFREWILSNFGQPLSDIFMFPYNYKVWAHPPELMNYSWIGERVSVVDLARIQRNFVSKLPDKNWGPNNQFWFPKKGGTGTIWKNVTALIGRENFQFNINIRSIDFKLRRVILADGNEIRYKSLFSTIPLPTLGQLLSPPQESLIKNASQLLYSSGHIIGIGIKGPLPEHLHKKCWIYFSEDQNPCYRVTIFSNYSPSHVPHPGMEYSLLCEVSSSKYKAVQPETLMAEVIAGLISTTLMRPDDEILSKWYFKAHYSYPTPSLERDRLLKELLLQLETFHIYSRGRFGGWKYEVANQDHSFMQGVDWVNRQISNNPENVFQI
ncbi:MAG: amine oxidase [Bdellovibrionales bacterium GWA2_49_15]|nr:MAG: amine oxidase [Bdellovibrionales bacterium GWA2_49_15]HAZ13985.1 amine oxidase [Bdellovibrionales bacterium]